MRIILARMNWPTTEYYSRILLKDFFNNIGHEDAFQQPRRSARCRFSQRTFAGTQGNGQEAPISAVHPAHAQDRRGSTRKPPFPHSASDTMSSILHPSARGRVALC